MSYKVLCRACLAGNVRIHWIRNTPLQVIYERLTNYKLVTKDERPETICFNCLAQLQNYHRFCEKSHKSDEILTKFSENGIEINQDTITIFNKGIQRDYSLTDMEIYSCPKFDQLMVKQEDSVKDITESLQVEADGLVADTDKTICMVCLIGDMKTFSIINTPLQAVFERLTDTKLKNRTDIVCYLCHWHLVKCRRFINKSKKSESILTELLRNGVQLSEATVALLNSRKKALLEIASVETTSYYSPEKDSREIQPKSPINTQTTKSGDYDYECKKCNYKSNSTSQYREHLSRHNPNYKFSCNKCNYRYKSSGHLMSHKRSVHRINYRCNKCDSKFALKRQFIMHMLSHTEESVNCQKCQKTFKNRVGLREHNKKTHKSDIYPCKLCKMTFTTEQCLCNHRIKMHTIHFPFYKCDYCDTTFLTKHRLQKHMKFVHLNIKKIKCEICNKMWGTISALNEHILIHTNTKSYKCTICCKSYRQKSSLYIHMKSHSGIRPYKCSLCDKSFTHAYALRTHYVSHNKLTCDLCNKQYLHKRFLREHIQNHMTKKKRIHTCLVCNKSFPLKEALKLHMYRHKYIPKLTPYETCPICKKQTKSLTVHVRQHTGYRPYKCKCGKEYTSKEGLRNHRRKKSNILHQCYVCDKKFKSKRYLKIHSTEHSGNNTHSCDICGYAFTHQAKLYNHIHSQHQTKMSCNECSLQFKQKRNLIEHIANCHSQKDYYTCDMCFKVCLSKSKLVTHIKSHKKHLYKCNNKKCNKSFTKMSSFAEHRCKDIKIDKAFCNFCNVVCTRLKISRHYVLKHNGIKPFACNSCGDTFVMFNQVYRHYFKWHDGGSPYECKYCVMRFKLPYMLRKHMIRCHFDKS